MKMLKSIAISPSFAFIALILCFQANASSLFGTHSRKNTIINARATSSGIINLKKDSDNPSSFYVEADLAYDGPDSTTKSRNSNNDDDDVPVTGKMMISIPNVESMVASHCLNFNYYDCSEYRCQQYGGSKTIEYPSFSVNAKTGRADMYLDYKYWSFEDTTDYLYTAKACTSSDRGSDIGLNRYGVLGFGTSDSSKHQFRSSKNFSIYIESDLSKGKLLFTNNTKTYAQSQEPLFKFYANKTWQLMVIEGSIKIGYDEIDIEGNLAFDINSDAIALPFNVYKQLLSFLGTSFGFRCNYTLYKPVCNATKQIKNLPPITLIYNGENIDIPSKIYATPLFDKTDNSSFYLNFRATDPNLVGKSYVTPSFKNSIILDANFMSYYYTTFDFSTGTNYVYLYQAKHPSPQPVDPNNIALWIAAAVTGVIILVGLGYYCVKKKRADAPFNSTTDIYKTPLLSNT